MEHEPKQQPATKMDVISAYELRLRTKHKEANGFMPMLDTSMIGTVVTLRYYHDFYNEGQPNKSTAVKTYRIAMLPWLYQVKKLLRAGKPFTTVLTNTFKDELSLVKFTCADKNTMFIQLGVDQHSLANAIKFDIGVISKVESNVDGEITVQDGVASAMAWADLMIGLCIAGGNALNVKQAKQFTPIQAGGNTVM